MKKSVPVTLLLGRRFRRGPWDGLEIAKWLIAKGCDMRAHAANGETLLHIATDASDLEFIRYLLDQGMPANTPGRYALPALGSAREEDIALVLLQADTTTARMDDGGVGFKRYAIEHHWGRVVDWLDAH
ncbi:MAG TPA: ankyrin repeat domain-containing protein [Steroidobacteraceae bacterium]|nr:ankyrin repeat domain-containing protein [Steroidobacteraceae bacterium]